MKKCDFSSKAKCWKNKSWGFYCDCVGLSVKCGKRGLLVWHSRTLYAIPSSIQSVGKKRRWYLAGRGRRLVAQCIVPCLPPARIHFDSFVTSFGPLPHESRHFCHRRLRSLYYSLSGIRDLIPFSIRVPSLPPYL